MFSHSPAQHIQAFFFEDALGLQPLLTLLLALLLDLFLALVLLLLLLPLPLAFFGPQCRGEAQVRKRMLLRPRTGKRPAVMYLGLRRVHADGALREVGKVALAAWVRRLQRRVDYHGTEVVKEQILEGDDIARGVGGRRVGLHLARGRRFCSLRGVHREPERNGEGNRGHAK
jgi:hypothetical protein